MQAFARPKALKPPVLDAASTNASRAASREGSAKPPSAREPAHKTSRRDAARESR
jgi:hypothetical protein